MLLCVWAWARVYDRWFVEPRHFSSLAALAIATGLSAFTAGTDIYFAVKPSSLPPWQSPEVALKGSLFLLAPIGVVIGWLAHRRRGPTWLFWIVEIVSGYLTVYGLAVASTF
jgi:hypothetical protein